MIKGFSFLAMIFMGPMIFALDVDFDCPESVSVNEEFKCLIDLNGGEGIYDAKVEIEKNEKNVAKIFDIDKNEWQSAYYYLKEFIGNEKKEVMLTILEEGKFNGILKLRLGEKREFFDFEIVVGDSNNAKEEETKILENKSPELGDTSKEKMTISLNPNKTGSDYQENIVYESKNMKVMRYVPYAFSLFLIFVIGFLIWEKF
ncbi:MAG: hypothetical protein WC548_02855 [Candidatus Pacearchaeota archaeon]